MDAAATRDERRTKRTAKACGLGAPTLALRFAGLSSRNDGGKRARSPGRARISRKTIAQGRPDDCGVPVVANACAFYTAHAAAGATRTRSSLRPLILEGRFSCTTRADCAAGNVEPRSLVSLAPFLRGEGGVRGSIRALCSWREPLTRNSLPRISSSPRKSGRGNSRRFALGCLKLTP